MKVVKNVPQTPPPATYDILGLTEEEARLLRTIIYWNIGGEMDGPRKLFADIADALENVGITSNRYRGYSVTTADGNIYFHPLKS